MHSINEETQSLEVGPVWGPLVEGAMNTTSDNSSVGGADSVPLTAAEVLARNERLATRTLDDTAFILLRSKMVSLNDVGTFVWDHFASPSTVGDATRAVLDEFDTTEAQARPDVRTFVADMLSRSLLVRAA